MAQKRNKKLAEKVAARIKELRTGKNIKQEDFYFDTGIHIGRLETGSFFIQIDTLYKICKYLNISLKEFFSEGFDDL